MKKESVNTFDSKSGLMLDLHPAVTPNSVLTDNLNGTFITYNGNEFSLQNDRGNHCVASLKEGYVPIGAKEYNGIIYIISVADTLTEDGKINTAQCLTEIGTYPGVDWSISRDETTGEATGTLDYNNYTPFGNYKANDSENYGNFTDVEGLGYSTLTPITIEIQPSYDGSVNLILTDGVNPVRIINSGFSVLPNDEYKLIKRNQTVETNMYEYERLDDLNLIRTNNIITNVNLVEVVPGGQLKGGNYTFYVKFGDSDYNQTDIVAESGIISIFKGNDCTPSVISGTVMDERTDKMIHITIDGLNHTYSKIYLYYSREYSDTLGYRLTEYGALKEPFEMSIDGDSQDIWITGYEQSEAIDFNELKIDYHTFDNARAMAQQQNMLFLGNLGSKETFELYRTLKNFVETAVQTTVGQNLSDSLEPVDYKYNKDKKSDVTNSEYYSTQNIYKHVGYWPDEWYRFGIVFVLNDGATTPVFNMRGGWFEKNEAGVWNRRDWKDLKDEEGNPVFTSDPEIDNCYGVFKTPKMNVFSEFGRICPIHFVFSLNPDQLPENVIGYFYVRQKRIPTTLCQGLSMGIDMRSHLPVTWNGKNWITQSFLSLDRSKSNVVKSDDAHLELTPLLQYTSNVQHSSTEEQSYNGFLLGGLLYDSVSIFETESDLNSVQSIYDVDPDFDWESDEIHLYKFQYYYYLTRGNGNKYQLVTPNGTSAPTEYLYYVSGKNLENLSELIWIVNQTGKLKSGSTPGPLYWDTDSGDLFSRLNSSVALTNAQWKINSVQSVSKDFDKKYIVYPSNITEEKVKECALLSLDPCVNPTVRNILDGSKFELVKEFETATYFGNEDTESFLVGPYYSDSTKRIWEENTSVSDETSSESKCVFVPSNTKIKEMDGIGFSNVAGEASDASRFSYSAHQFGVRNDYRHKTWLRTVFSTDNTYGPKYRTIDLADSFNTVEERAYEDKDLADKKPGFTSILNVNLIRGLFTPFIGTNETLSHGIWSIKLNSIDILNAFLTRRQDETSYYTVSDRISVEIDEMLSDETSTTQTRHVYRGDCFTNTVSMRIVRNFIDPNVPVSDNILDPDGWDVHIRRWGDYAKEPENKDMKSAEWNELNLADVNTVDLGYWVTYKCLSSYNLGLRAEDYSNDKEVQLIGSPRSFYPLNGGSIATGNKMEESFLLNDGYSATVSAKTYELFPNVPYTTSEFANRIIFSNVQVDSAFSNGYRIYQGAAFKDYDKQYGAITKLVPWDNNLIVVMEHGIGVVGVNEQALMQTSTGDSIHIYGHGVLSDHMQIISADYGTKYEHSVIRTPLGVYGIDTDVRKIWRFGSEKGFETLSDMKIESYLNEELGTNASVDLPLYDVRTHYNETKGDLMFTFYRKDKDIKPKIEAEKEEKDYLYLNTSKITSVPGEEVTRTFSTNLEDLEIYSDDENVATVSVNLENNTLTVTMVADGTCCICTGDKKIPVKVLNEFEIAEAEQEQTANVSNAVITTEIDEETGEEVVVVKSNLIISAGSYSTSSNIDESVIIPVKFKNNNQKISLSDCAIETIFEDTECATIIPADNNIYVVPTAEGKVKVKVSYPNATGFETNWIAFETPVFTIGQDPSYGDGDTLHIVTFRGNYSTMIPYHGAVGPVIVNIDDESIITGGVSEDYNVIWLYAKKIDETTGIGETTGTVVNGDTTIHLRFSVVEPVYLTSATFYDGETEIDRLEGFSMRVGETKNLTFVTIPEDLSKNTRSAVIDLKNNNPEISGQQVATRTYSFDGRYCNITAVSPGTITLDFAVKADPGGGTIDTLIPITVYE